jgi:Tol biopolymer transport system component
MSAITPPVFHMELWFLSYPEGAARRITYDPSNYSDLSISSNGSVLAAVRNASILNLWTQDVQRGSDARQLTSATAQENAVLSYNVGRDGSVVFRSNDESHPLWRIDIGSLAPTPVTTVWPPGWDWLTLFRSLPDRGLLLIHLDEKRVRHIWRVDPDGGNPRQVTVGRGESLADVSPDGRTVIFSTLRPTQALWAGSVEGGEPIKLAAPFVAKGHVSYSPDGTRIAYLDLTELDEKPHNAWTVISSTDGRQIASLPLDPGIGHGIGFPDVEWTGDGKALSFLDEVDGIANVFRQTLDARKPVAVTRFTGGQIRDHEWSPDGSRLLIVRGNGRIENIWMTRADGSEAIQLTDFKTGRIGDVDWMPPDGRRIIFTYGQASSDVVLIKNFR